MFLLFLSLSDISRFDVRRADWGRFDEAFAGEARAWSVASEVGAESMACCLDAALLRTSQASMPLRRNRKRVNSWWTHALTLKKRMAYRARVRYQRADTSEVRAERKIEYRAARREYKKSVCAAKMQGWRDFVTREGNAKPWGYVYRAAANKLRASAVLSTLRTSDGESTRTMGETAALLLNIHVPDDNPAEDTAQQRETRERVRGLESRGEDARDFTDEEVRVALKSFVNGKAPGRDRVEVAVLKRVVCLHTHVFTRVFNACLAAGVFPTAWKEGTLCTLLKSPEKDRTDPKG